MRNAALLSWLTLLLPASVLGYGGGGGSSGCAEPKFFEPKPSAAVAALTEFSFVASANTDPATLSVAIGGEKHPVRSERRRNGDYDVKLVLPAPIATPGTLRIGVNAKSVDGCWGFQPYSVEIRP